MFATVEDIYNHINRKGLCRSLCVRNLYDKVFYVFALNALDKDDKNIYNVGSYLTELQNPLVHNDSWSDIILVLPAKSN